MFSKINESRLQQRSRGANSVATISERADKIYFVFAWSERIAFGVKACERLFSVDGCHESVLFGQRLTRMSKNGISLSCSNSMENLILQEFISSVFAVKHSKSVINVPIPK